MKKELKEDSIGCLGGLVSLFLLILMLIFIPAIPDEKKCLRCGGVAKKHFEDGKKASYKCTSCGHIWISNT